eukprot:scaffold4496_cov128-Isochrysis_galbana.AAC.1
MSPGQEQIAHARCRSGGSCSSAAPLPWHRGRTYTRAECAQAQVCLCAVGPSAPFTRRHTCVCVAFYSILAFVLVRVARIVCARVKCNVSRVCAHGTWRMGTCHCNYTVCAPGNPPACRPVRVLMSSAIFIQMECVYNRVAHSRFFSDSAMASPADARGLAPPHAGPLGRHT